MLITVIQERECNHLQMKMSRFLSYFPLSMTMKNLHHRHQFLLLMRIATNSRKLVPPNKGDSNQMSLNATSLYEDQDGNESYPRLWKRIRCKARSKTVGRSSVKNAPNLGNRRQLFPDQIARNSLIRRIRKILPKGKN